jgi:DNA-binding transcriptional regulator YiaG
VGNAYISPIKEEKMGKIESTVKSEIQRLAKREVKSAFLPLRREVRSLRLKFSGLSRNLKALNQLAKEQIIPLASEKSKLQASPEEIKTARLTPERIRNLRRKLGISQKGLATLAGVSVGAVVMWEKGKFRPKGEKKGLLIALRKLGKRQVKKMLAEKRTGEESKSKVKARRTRRAIPKGARRGKKIRRARKGKK